MRRAGRIALFLCAAVLLSAAGCGRREPDIDVVDGAEAPEEAVFPGESFTVLRTGRKYGCDGALSRAEHLRDLEMREALSVSPETETTESDGATAERYLTTAAAGEDRYTLVVGSLRGAGYPITAPEPRLRRRTVRLSDFRGSRSRCPRAGGGVSRWALLRRDLTGTRPAC